MAPIEAFWRSENRNIWLCCGVRFSTYERIMPRSWKRSVQELLGHKSIITTKR